MGQGRVEACRSGPLPMPAMGGRRFHQRFRAGTPYLPGTDKESAVTVDHKWRRTLGQKVRHLTPEQCKEMLARINHESRNGATIFHATIRDLTGGLNSQTINFAVVRKLAEKAKEAT